MLRQLHEKDREQVLEFLSVEPSINLFIIGDIEAFGFELEFQTLWGEFTEEGEIEGVLLRFNESFIPYYINPAFDISGFVEIILEYKCEKMVSGKESVLRRFMEVLPSQESKTTYFCELDNSDKIVLDNNKQVIKIANQNDAKRIYDLLDQIEEFNGIANSVDRIKHKLETKTGRIYYMENEDGLMVSVAQTSAENSKSAMIVGVATLEAYRGKGLMSQCLSKLCIDVLEEGKALCLFYDNPRAGHVYHRLGFNTIDNWTMITMNEY